MNTSLWRSVQGFLNSKPKPKTHGTLSYLSVPFVLQAMDLYLAVIMGIFSDQSHQMHARMVRGEGLAYVPLETVARMVNKLLPITDKVQS